MNPNPALGVFFHWLGGLASASFYVPYRGVKHWAWETFWLVGGFFSWIIAPWILASIMTKDVLGVLSATPAVNLFWPYFFGALWGIGGLTFGLTMRYLGMSLGMAVALGYCAAFGTLMPPLFEGEFASKVLGTTSGLVILGGVAVCLLGIALAGMAGVSKERNMTPEQRQEVIKEFSLKKGLLIATLSGVMSSCFAYGLAAGDPIKALTLKAGTPTLWQGLPVLVVVLLGGFTTNFIWSVYLNVRNRTGHQYLASKVQVAAADLADAESSLAGPRPGEAAVAVAAPAGRSVSVPMLRNYLLCALAGTTWYLQFFFYTMGETQMGKFKFSSWTLHMASIIIFSSLWGLALHEWRGSGKRAMRFLFAGLALLVLSTVIVGYGNYLATAQ
jgi:L-rhamnose-H+ transport protein